MVGSRSHRALGLALAMGIALAGCGTIGGMDEIISVDSYPRGLEVRDTTQSKLLGHTPTFVEKRRSFSQAYELGPPEQPGFSVNLDCGVNWLGSVLPNGLLSLGGLPVAAVVFGVDAVSGGLFECDEQQHFKFSDPIVADLVAEGDPCYRILVVPPPHIDEAFSDELAERWIASVRNKFKACDEFLYTEDTKTSFTFYEIDHTRTHSFRGTSYRILKRIGLEHQATHIVYLKVYDRGERLVATATAYDLHTKQRLERQSLGIVTNKPADYDQINLRKVILQGINFLPNSIGYANGLIRPADGEPGATDSNIVKESSEELRLLPRYLTGFNLENVDHPSHHSTWDLNLRFYPTVGMIWNETVHRLRFVDDAGEMTDKKDYEVDIFYVIAPFNLAATAHTPVGAFTLGVGFGPSYVSASDNEGKSGRRISAAATTFYEYTAMLTQQWYFRSGARYYYTRGSDVDLTYTNPKRWIYGYAGIGYYFPAMGHRLRRFLER